MKKFLSLFLIFVIITFCLTACGIPVQNTVPTNPPLDSIYTTATTENSNFSVHYIDVGQGDAALILCDNKSMLIDGGKPKASDIIYTYLNKQGITHLDYIICSHADEDHVGGLSGALSAVSVGAVYAPETEADTKTFQNFKRKVHKQGLEIQHLEHGSSFTFGSSTVQVLGPITENTSERNNTSIVLKILYGETSFLFTGDAEFDEEHDILEQGYDLSATVLKVSHHGSAGATSYRFLREVLPKYAVISVDKDNAYGHPTEEVLSKLRDADVKVYRTDMQGDIIAESDGKNLTITPSKNSDADTLTTKKSTVTSKPATNKNESNPKNIVSYIGNQNSKKFHLPNCHTLPAEHNRVYFSTRDEAIQKGYNPCQNCNP